MNPVPNTFLELSREQLESHEEDPAQIARGFRSEHVLHVHQKVALRIVAHELEQVTPSGNRSDLRARCGPGHRHGWRHRGGAVTAGAGTGSDAADPPGNLEGSFTAESSARAITSTSPTSGASFLTKPLSGVRSGTDEFACSAVGPDSTMGSISVPGNRCASNSAISDFVLPAAVLSSSRAFPALRNRLSISTAERCRRPSATIGKIAGN
jgi:hypothetical protein